MIEKKYLAPLKLLGTNTKAEKANGSITAAAYDANGKAIADKRQSLA